MKAKTSLAHCVSEDLKMFRGLAASFREQWPGQINELRKMDLKVGDVGAIKVEDRFIYHLIIKEFCNDQPKYDPLRQAFVKLKEHMVENEITEISLPKLGTGKNQLSWPVVKMMIEEVFENTDIKIIIYDFDMAKKTTNGRNGSRFVAKDDDTEGEKVSEKVSIIYQSFENFKVNHKCSTFSDFTVHEAR